MTKGPPARRATRRGGGVAYEQAPGEDRRTAFPELYSSQVRTSWTVDELDACHRL